MNVPTQNAAKAWIASFIQAISTAIYVSPRMDMIPAVKILTVILAGLVTWQAVYWTPNRDQ